MRNTRFGMTLLASMIIAVAPATYAAENGKTDLSTLSQSISKLNDSLNQFQSTQSNLSSQSADAWTKQDQVESAAWSMDQTEWKRYKELMSYGPNAAYYKSKPEVTPLMVLGFNASNEAERAEYARRALQMEIARLGREIKFDEAWNQQIKAMTPNHPIWMSEQQRRSFMKAQAGISSTSTSIKITDTRVVAYADANDCDATCKGFLRQFARASTPVSRFDLFVLNGGSDNDIINFGASIGIDQSALSARRATLNRDAGYYARLQPSPGLPVAYRVGLNGQTTKVTP